MPTIPAIRKQASLIAKETEKKKIEMKMCVYRGTGYQHPHSWVPAWGLYSTSLEATSCSGSGVGMVLALDIYIHLLRVVSGFW
jgi:hypothetical protein